MSDEPEEPQSDNQDDLLDALTAVLPPVMTGIDVCGQVARHLHPPELANIVAGLERFEQPIVAGLEVFNAQTWPEHLQRFQAAIGETATNVLKAFEGLRGAPSHSSGAMAAYSALRYNTRALESLYPLTAMLPPVSRFFVEHDKRDDASILARIDAGDPSKDNVGIVHAGNASNERGGFSLYVPEYYDGSPMPLVVAMHGGSGHGRGFLMTWLRAARTHGAILLSPTSQGQTWSLMGPDVDTAAILDMLKFVRDQWNVDESRMLLTGMSDGGTFSYVSGLLADSPFTHLSPISASFHPLLLEEVSAARIQDLPIYLVHGALDWMFPVEVAQTAEQALSAAGAQVVYREIADLSHTYPSEENGRILEWLIGDGGR